MRRLRARDLDAVLQQERAFLTERDCDQGLLADNVGLVAVRDDEIRLDRERPRRRRIDAEPVRLRSRLLERLVRNLELAEHVAFHREAADQRIRTGHDDDDVLAVLCHEDDRHSRRSIDLSQVEHHAGLEEPTKRLLGVRIGADAADHPNLRAQPRSRDRLVGALATGNALEGCAGQRLPRPR